MSKSIWIAAAGGLVYSVFPILEAWKTSRESRPDFSDWLYWLPYIFWPVLGAFVAYLYDGPELRLSKMLSFQIGISTPLIIRSMVKISPAIPNHIELRDENQ